MAEPKKVRAEDGNDYEFGEKAKVKKQSYVTDDGVVVIKFVFNTGAVRTFKISDQKMILRLAQHGGDQKAGDEFAGTDDVEDCVMAFESMGERLMKGEWSERKAGEGVAGTSLLARALAEFGKRDIAEVKELLKKADPKVKAAAAKKPEIAAIINRMKAERDEKKGVTPQAAEEAVAAIFG